MFLSKKKVKLVVSDFHLGKGRVLPDGSTNLLEDFYSDKAFVEFLDYYLQGDYRKAEVELIINGDFFNLLQIDYQDRFTDQITESDALHKTMSILKGHPEMFKKISEFSKAPSHSVTFVLGNHDPGLLWPGVQEVLQLELGGKVNFILEYYRFDGVHVEHGNEYMADNRYDKECYFLSEGLPEPIINLPWGSFFVIHFLNERKKQRPYLDKVYPFRTYLRWALIHDTFFAIKSLFELAFYFLWFCIHRSPTHKTSFWDKLAILKEATVHPKLHREAKRILLSNQEVHTVIFGHTHHALYRMFAPNKEYFNTGSWNEKISLDVGSLGRVLKHTFVLIEYEDDKPRVSLKEWKGQSRIMEDVYF